MKLYCGECRQECEVKTVDFGHGRTEFWGAISVERNLQIVSECCEGELYKDPYMERKAA